MRVHTRRAVAYIAGRIASDRRSTAVYDYQEGCYNNMSGRVAATKVSVYDYDQGCHVSGSPASLFHYGNSAHISLKVTGVKFSGFDYDSKSHYSGKVSGKNVSLYDYETGQYYNYSI